MTFSQLINRQDYQKVYYETWTKDYYKRRDIQHEVSVQYDEGDGVFRLYGDRGYVFLKIRENEPVQRLQNGNYLVKDMLTNDTIELSLYSMTKV